MESAFIREHADGGGWDASELVGGVSGGGVPSLVAEIPADPAAPALGLVRQHGLVSASVRRPAGSTVKGSEGASGHRPVREQILLYPGVQELERWDESEGSGWVVGKRRAARLVISRVLSQVCSLRRALRASHWRAVGLSLSGPQGPESLRRSVWVLSPPPRRRAQHTPPPAQRREPCQCPV